MEKDAKSIIIILFTVAVFSAIIAEGKPTKNYSGYRVFRINCGDHENPEKLLGLFKRVKADIWKEPSVFYPHFDVMVSRRHLNAFQRSLSAINITFSTWIDDVQKVIRESEKQRRRHRKRHTTVFRYDEYHNYTTILKWMRIFTRSNNDIMSMLQVGTTYQSRKIWGIKIAINKNSRKPIFWQDALIHAREWVTGATLLWVANRLVQGYRRQETDVVDLLTEMDFIFVPVWNIDGYIFSHVKDRLWRRSRSRPGCLDTRGVDLNRNFHTPTLGRGAYSNSMCSDVYRGTRPFSEAETASVSRFLESLPLAAAVSLHSFGQLLLYPFGYTAEASPDSEELDAVASQATEAIAAVHGTSYRYGSISRTVYKVSGGSVDWLYDSLCVRYSFGVELRDEGKYGFLLPPKYIIPTAEEYYAALKILANHVVSSNSTRSSLCDQADSRED